MTDNVAETSYSIEDEIDYAELEKLLNKEIDTLPEQRRKVFLMSRQKGLSNGEIAETLGISKRTVETHISLALTALRKALPLYIVVNIMKATNTL